MLFCVLWPDTVPTVNICKASLSGPLAQWITAAASPKGGWCELDCSAKPTVWLHRWLRQFLYKASLPLLGRRLELQLRGAENPTRTENHQDWTLRHRPRIPALENWRPEDQDLKAILGYTVNLRPAWAA